MTINMKMWNKIKDWRQKRLRKKVIFLLLSNLNHKPDGYNTSGLADSIVYYINTGELD